VPANLGYAAPRVSGVDPELIHEIEVLIGEAVARFGVAGRVRIAAGVALLEGSGPTSRVEIGALLEQWDTLPRDIRHRRVNELARQLVGDRRAATKTLPGRRFAVLGWILPLLIVVGGGALVYVAYQMLAPGQHGRAAVETPDGPAAPSSTLGDEDRSQRGARICNITRARVMRGASVGPADVEGWVVELVLLRAGDTPPLDLDPGLDAFIRRSPGQASGSFVWDGAQVLAALHGPMTHVTVTDASLPPSGKARFRGVALTFSGRYVTPYFTESERGDYLKTADALATRLGALYGALYAHCAGGTTHHIGSWFRGPDPAGAAAALVYFVGTYAPGSQVRHAVLAPHGKLDRVGALERIAQATRQLDKRRTATLLGDSGGSIAVRPGGPATLLFPFHEANRAERGSEAIANAVRLSH
jgi:serine/threonine-protein kinase